jgi:hypothetical protein
MCTLARGATCENNVVIAVELPVALVDFSESRSTDTRRHDSLRNLAK